MPKVPPTVVTESVAIRPLQIPLQGSNAIDVSGLTRGIDVATDVLERTRLQLSEIRISGAETAILNRWNARLIEDDDAYFKLGGQDAVESLDTFYQEIDDIVNEEMTNRLKTATEKRLLRDALALRRMNNRSKMAMHSFDARQEWDKTTALANRAAQFEAAISDPSPENLRLSRERIIDETNAISKVDNLPPEAAELNRGIAVSKMYRGTIENLIAQQKPFQAQAIFDRYEKEILGEDQTDLTEALSKATIAAESSALALEARQTGGSAEEQLDFVRRKFGKNPSAAQREVIESALSKVTTQRNQIETAQGIARSENYNFLGERVIAATSSGARGIEIIEQLEGLFPERFQGEVLTTSQRATLVALAGVGQPTVTTDQGIKDYLQIMEWAVTDPARLANLDPADYLGSMSSTHFDRVEKAINEARGAGITRETAAHGRRQKTLNEISQKHGFDLTATTLSGAALLIQREQIERLDEFVAAQKRQPTEQEWVDIVDRMFVKFLLEDTRPLIDTESIFAVPKAVFRGFGGPEEQFAFRLQAADITPLQRKTVIGHFRSVNGRDPLPNEIETHFITLMGDPAARKLLLGN